MSYHGNRYFTGAAPYLITDEDVTALTLQNQGAWPVKLVGTVGAVPPAEADPGINLAPGVPIVAEDMAALFPGIGATRIYAFALGMEAKIFVSHA